MIPLAGPANKQARILADILMGEEKEYQGSLGQDGVDKRIDTIAPVMRLGGSTEDLTKLELAYAPPFSSAKDPVNML